jgi:hypothetical protein
MLEKTAKRSSNLRLFSLAGSFIALATIAFCIVHMAQEAVANATSTNYFPHQIGEFCQRWYGDQLTAMGEAPIYKLAKPDGRFVFRFTWLRTFHHPMCVRLEHSKDGKTVLFGKELNGAGGYQPGILITDRKIELTAQQYEAFKAKLASVNFVQLATEEKDLGGHDGARWIFELNDNGCYHVVDRWCPNGAIRELGCWFLEAANLTPKDHIY